jgi:hypothetical protein
MNTKPGLCALLIGSFLAVSLSASGDDVSLADAVDNHTFFWSSGGEATWIAQTGVTHDGVDAAESGPVADNGTSVLQTEVAGPVTISFCWKVSSQQDADFLGFYVDDAQTAKIERIVLVPKLYLGTELFEQLYCEAREAELHAQARSQVQLGNARNKATECGSNSPFEGAEGDVWACDETQHPPAPPSKGTWPRASACSATIPKRRNSMVVGRNRPTVRCGRPTRTISEPRRLSEGEPAV